MIEDIPNKDSNWSEKYFFFKICPASVALMSEFERVSVRWAENVG